MAKEASKAEPQKKGWFSNLFAAKPATEVLANVAKDLVFSVGVSDTGEASVTISGESYAVSKFSKALKGDDVAFTDGKKRGSIVVTGEAALAKLTGITDNVRNSPKGINFLPLRDRATEEAMAGLTDREMFALRNQNDPTLGMLSSIIKLAVRDKREAIDAAKPAAAPKPRVDKPTRAAPAPEPAADETDFTMNNNYRVRVRNDGILVAVPQHLTDGDWIKGIEDLRAASGDSGLISVQRYRSRNDPQRTGIKIIGVSKEELLGEDEKSVGNKVLVQRLQSVMQHSNAEVVSASEQEAATGTVSLDGTANDATVSNADMVKAFVSDVRSQLVAYEVARKEIRATKTDEEALSALQDLAQSRQTNMTFPKDSKMVVIRDTRKGQDEMIALRDALNEQGYKASVVGVTNLYIDLTPGHESGHAARLAADGSEDRSPEDTLKQLLSTGFKPNEVDQMVGEYSKRNAAVQVSKDWL